MPVDVWYQVLSYVESLELVQVLLLVSKSMNTATYSQVRALCSPFPRLVPRGFVVRFPLLFRIKNIVCNCSYHIPALVALPLREIDNCELSVDPITSLPYRPHFHYTKGKEEWRAGYLHLTSARLDNWDKWQPLVEKWYRGPLSSLTIDISSPVVPLPDWQIETLLLTASPSKRIHLLGWMQICLTLLPLYLCIDATVAYFLSALPSYCHQIGVPIPQGQRPHQYRREIDGTYRLSYGG